MIKISKLSDYATVILSMLAQTPMQRVSANQIAEGTQLPIPTVSKVLKLLNEAKLVSSTRGTNGGYTLCRCPTLISVAEIIHAIEGELAMTECSKEALSCSRNEFCGLRHNWQYINYMMVMLLQQLSLADMNQPLNKVVCVRLVEDTLNEP